MLNRIRRGRSRQECSSERGTALVEFALVLPLLAVICFGTVDFGRAYLTWNQLKNAAREGAAYAQTHPGQQDTTGSDGCAGLNNIKAQALKEIGPTPDPEFFVKVTPEEMDGSGCDPSNPPVSSGGPIVVEVRKTFNLITPFISGFMGDPVITGRVSMVVQ